MPLTGYYSSGSSCCVLEVPKDVPPITGVIRARAQDSVLDAVTYDPHTFRKHFKNIGRAYREQATTLIELCRLYAETSSQDYAEHDHLQKIFQLADVALDAAGKAKQGTTYGATYAFLRVQAQITQFGAPSLRKDTLGDSDHRKRLADPSNALAIAAKKDEEKTTLISKLLLKSAFKAPKYKGPVRNVKFMILKSPHERLLDQPIVHQEIDKSTTTTEIIWRFSRYRENSAVRIAFKKNPHFYHGLPDKAARYDSKFNVNALNDFAYVYHHQIKTIYVLVDKSCRLFLDSDKSRIQRVFCNLWKPDQTVILKDFVGNLESQDIVLHDIGENRDYWYRTADPSLRRMESNDSSLDSIIVQKPFENVRAVVNTAVRIQNLDLMIRDPTMKAPDPTKWKRLPRPEPIIISTFTLGSDTLSATSTAVNPSDSSLLMPVDPRTSLCMDVDTTW